MFQNPERTEDEKSLTASTNSTLLYCVAGEVSWGVLKPMAGSHLQSQLVLISQNSVQVLLLFWPSCCSDAKVKIKMHLASSSSRCSNNGTLGSRLSQAHGIICLTNLTNRFIISASLREPRFPLRLIRAVLYLRLSGTSRTDLPSIR